MAEYFQIPEVGTKVRPGAYFNVDKNGDEDSFGAIDGVVVAVFKASFGPVDKVTILERGDNYTSIYGDGLTTDLIREALYGGAKKVICCRLNGTGGTASSVSLTAATGKIKISSLFQSFKYSLLFFRLRFTLLSVFSFYTDTVLSFSR